MHVRFTNYILLAPSSSTQLPAQRPVLPSNQPLDHKNPLTKGKGLSTTSYVVNHLIYIIYHYQKQKSGS